MRLVVAAAMPLSPDEAYYWVWSRALAPGYLDHPPMVALWIWAGTAVAGDSELGVRLLAPLSAAAGSVLLAGAGDALFPGRRAGLAAAVLLNATLMLGVGAVTMTPDTPLIFFWTATVAALTRVRQKPDWWLAVGGAAGLALDSKYTAAFLGVAILLWLVVSARAQFRCWQLWAGGALAGALFAPVMAWNAAHGWVSFVKQGGRTGDWQPAKALTHLAELFAGQVALATPWIAGLFVAGIVYSVRRARDPAWMLVAALTVPALLVFVQHAVGDRVQANWPSIVYPGAALAAAGLGWRWRGAATLGFAMGAAVMLQATATPLHLPRAYDPLLIRLGGWDRLAAATAGLAAGAGGFVAAENYALAALLAWHTRGVPVLAADPRWALFALPRAAGGDGVLLLSTRRAEPPDPAVWARAVPLADLARAQNGVVAETYQAYHVTLRGLAVILPERRF